MIYAANPDGVIGSGGKLPWRHPGDTRRFKRVTSGTTVVMGRRTFESMGVPLPNRRNVVVTSRRIATPGIECIDTLSAALSLAGDADTWLIGGAAIYTEGMRYADLIDVTYVPDVVVGTDLTYAPRIDESVFEPGPLLAHEDEPGLTRRVYRRRPA